DTWERVRSRITHAPIGRRPKTNLLAGFCRCGNVLSDGTVCGATMATLSEKMDKVVKPGGRPPRRMIACDKANHHGCGSNTVKAEEVEKIVIAHVLEAADGVNLRKYRTQ